MHPFYHPPCPPLSTHLRNTRLKSLPFAVCAAFPFNTHRTLFAPRSRVFGLNSAAEKLKKTTLTDVKCPAPPCLDKAYISKAPMKLLVTGKQTQMMPPISESTITDEAGTTLFTVTSASGMMSIELTYKSPSGDVIAVFKGSNGMLKATSTITKGTTDAAFGEIVVSKGFTASTASYKVGDAEVYKAEKYTTLYLLLSILAPDGKLVGKVSQPGT